MGQISRGMIGILALLAPSLVWAQEQPALNIELNAAETTGGACKLTFVLSNETGTDIDQAVAETVLFSDQGAVMLLTLFDFGTLPNSRPRVRQFQVPNTACETVGQVLVNGVQNCTVDGAESDVCLNGLTLSSRVDIALEG